MVDRSGIPVDLMGGMLGRQKVLAPAGDTGTFCLKLEGTEIHQLQVELSHLY